jgi:hypothetical protein
LNAAFVAAVFGIVGTLIGGVLTYLTDHALQDQQISAQAARDTAAARAAALFAMLRYQKIDDEITGMLGADMFIKVPGGLPADISAADEELIVTRVTSQGLRAIATADDDTDVVRALVAARHDGDPLRSYDRVILRGADRQLRVAIATLSAFGGR